MIISSTEGADMKKHTSLELRVSVDIGCRNHNVAIGLSRGRRSGQVLYLSISYELAGRPSDLQYYLP